MAGVLQAESALNQQQGHLKAHAVVAIGNNVLGLGELADVAGGDVVGVGVGHPAVVKFIVSYAVVVQDGDARDSEQGAEGKRLRPEREPAQQG